MSAQLERRYYAILSTSSAIETGVYYANFDTELRHLVERPGVSYERVKDPDAGFKWLADEGYLGRRHLLEKAVLLHHRCWYCARVLDPHSVQRPDSTEEEHQVPRSTFWKQVERPENIVPACRRCNNDDEPGKGNRNVQGFRDRLSTHYGVLRTAFYGDILRWLNAHGRDMGLEFPLSADDAQLVLHWYTRSRGLRLHTWRDGDDLFDYATGLQLPIPADAPPYPLGALWRLETPSIGEPELDYNDF